MKRGLSCNILGLFAVVLAGCSSPQMSRIDRNRAIYETWPLETKQAVLDGKVEVGMNYDMVRVSWGQPTEVTTSPAGDEIWVYAKGGGDGSVYYPGGNAGNTVMGSGTGIGIATGRGGTSIGGTTGIGIGGVGMGNPGMGSGGAIVTPPTPPEIREVVFRDGLVIKADKP